MLLLWYQVQKKRSIRADLPSQQTPIKWNVVEYNTGKCGTGYSHQMPSQLVKVSSGTESLEFNYF